MQYQSWISLPRDQTSELLKHCGDLVAPISHFPAKYEEMRAHIFSHYFIMYWMLLANFNTANIIITRYYYCYIVAVTLLHRYMISLSDIFVHREHLPYSISCGCKSSV